MRRDARDEGATQPEVLQLSNASRRSDGYAWKATGNTPGDPPDAPQGEGGPQGQPKGRRKSAEGVVGAQSGEASEALQGRKAEQTDRPNRKVGTEGPNGGRAEWPAKCKGQSKEQDSMKAMQMQLDLEGEVSGQ